MYNLYLILAPTIICKIASNSSFEIKSSLSKSYILNATEKRFEIGYINIGIFESNMKDYYILFI